MRCDQLPASSAGFLARLSKIIGAAVENPEDLTPLRYSLESKETLIILDNAESILDPQGPSAREIYAIVNELCRFKTVCLCLTARITTVPPHCARPEIPTLSMEAACDIFYSIYRSGGRSDVVNNLLQRLDFHALSITLLATTASHNMWDYNRLVKEWDAGRARVLRTDYNESLASTIELSLGSPSFCKLGPDARGILGVIAFFPQGIDEEHLDQFFPTISDGKNIFDKFCVLSLTYRNNGFVTMLAPIRDYLTPADPRSSPLLCATKDHYFTRLSVDIYPEMPGFGETRWIVSEDVNVEHLLDVFTSIDANSRDAWDGCDHFMVHLFWHKPRKTALRAKIEGLPDDHPSKASCLFNLSRLFELVGNHTERKNLLIHVVKLWRERGDDVQVALALRNLSDVNRWLELHEEARQLAKEALEICERIGDSNGQSHSLYTLGLSFFVDGEFDAAEDATSRAIDLVQGKGQERLICQSHHLLGFSYFFKAEKEKGLHHFQTALGIASRFNWHDDLFSIHRTLAGVFYDEDRLDDAEAQLAQAKSYAGNNIYRLGCLMTFQVIGFYLPRRRLEDAKSAVSHALEIFEKLGAAKDVEDCMTLLQGIEQGMKTRPTGSLQ